MDIDHSELLQLSFLLILNNIILTFSIINALVVLVTTCILVWVFVYLATVILDILIVSSVSSESLGRLFLFVPLLFLIFFGFLMFGVYYFTSCSSNAFANSYLMISLTIFQSWVINLVYVTPFSIRIGKELDSNIIAISGLLYPLLVTSLLGSILFLLGVTMLSEKKFP